MTAKATTARLDEFDKTEWRDVARQLHPDWTDDEFDGLWAEFQEMKSRKAAQ